MNNLPVYIALLFGFTTFITIGIFYLASIRSKTTLIILLIWLVIQSCIGISGFYTVTDSIPPRFILAIGPPFLFIAGLLLTAKGRKFIDGLDIQYLTILHTIRIPVEATLFLLFIHKMIPEIMTFEGRNFDILSGLSAPLIYYFGFRKKQFGRRTILFWNFLCLALLVNIVVIAILSVPFPFQKIAFDQPNIAVLYFPYVWLPSLVVPLVLLSHIAVIRQLLKSHG
ncbi:hypothetical protein BH11BAC1_BH11BAC1_09860 [soil metagenome]